MFQASYSDLVYHLISIFSHCLFLYTNPIASELPLSFIRVQLSLACLRVMAGSQGARQMAKHRGRPQNCPNTTRFA
jgi:hypothetical protein